MWQGSGNVVNSWKPECCLVIINCPAWTVFTRLNLNQWWFSDSLKGPLSQEKLLNISLVAMLSSDQTQLTGTRKWSETGHFPGCPKATLPRNWHTWAPDRLPHHFPLRNTLFWNYFLQFLFLFQLWNFWDYIWFLKISGMMGKKLKIVFHVRHISTEQRMKWTVYQRKKYFFCLLWFTFQNNLLVKSWLIYTF